MLQVLLLQTLHAKEVCSARCERLLLEHSVGSGPWCKIYQHEGFHDANAKYVGDKTRGFG